MAKRGKKKVRLDYGAYVAMVLAAASLTVLLPKIGNSFSAAITSLAPNAPCTVREFPITTGENWNSLGITVGPDGNLWFTETDANKIGKMSPTGQMLAEFSIPTVDSTPMGITSANGKLWFTEVSANQVASLTPDGSTFMEYALPDYPENPGTTVLSYGITTGPDGNAWFAETYNNTIDKITSEGTITRYPIPTKASTPYYITSGDESLWFTEFDANKIGRATKDGTITEYVLPNPYDSPDHTAPFNIAYLPGVGAIFQQGSGNAAHGLGKLTSDGMISEYPTLNSTSGIVAVSDGAWMATGGNIIKIDSHFNIIASYPLPTGTSITSLTMGPDGEKPWFTLDGNAIGTIDCGGAQDVTQSSTGGGENLIQPVTTSGGGGVITRYSGGSSSSGRNTGGGGVITRYSGGSSSSGRNTGGGGVITRYSGGSSSSSSNGGGVMQRYPGPGGTSSSESSAHSSSMKNVVAPKADFSVQVTSCACVPGQPGLYKCIGKITNAGPNATTIAQASMAVSGDQIVDAVGGVLTDSQHVTWGADGTLLQPGKSVSTTVTFRHVTPAPSSITFQATDSAYDPNPANNTVTVVSGVSMACGSTSSSSSVNSVASSSDSSSQASSSESSSASSSASSAGWKLVAVSSSAGWKLVRISVSSATSSGKSSASSSLQPTVVFLTESSTSASSSEPNTCGDGHLDAGEECDDGNRVDGDGCSSKCTIEVGWSCETCPPSGTPVTVSSSASSAAGACTAADFLAAFYNTENLDSSYFPYLYTPTVHNVVKLYGKDFTPHTMVSINRNGEDVLLQLDAAGPNYLVAELGSAPSSPYTLTVTIPASTTSVGGSCTKTVPLVAYATGEPHFVTMNGDVFDDQAPWATYHLLQDGKAEDNENYVDIWGYSQPAGEGVTSIRGFWVTINGTSHYVGPGPYFVPTLENKKYALSFTENPWSSIGGGGIDLAITPKVGLGVAATSGYAGMLAPNPDKPFVLRSTDDWNALNANFAAFDAKQGLKSDPNSSIPGPPPKPGNPAPQCSDGLDNDGDGMIDAADPGCHLDGDASNPASYDHFANDESAVKAFSVPRTGALKPGPSAEGGSPYVLWSLVALVVLAGAGGTMYVYKRRSGKVGNQLVPVVGISSTLVIAMIAVHLLAPGQQGSSAMLGQVSGGSPVVLPSCSGGVPNCDNDGKVECPQGEGPAQCAGNEVICPMGNLAAHNAYCGPAPLPAPVPTPAPSSEASQPAASAPSTPTVAAQPAACTPGVSVCTRSGTPTAPTTSTNKSIPKTTCTCPAGALPIVYFTSNAGAYCKMKDNGGNINATCTTTYNPNPTNTAVSSSSASPTSTCPDGSTMSANSSAATNSTTPTVECSCPDGTNLYFLSQGYPYCASQPLPSGVGLGSVRGIGNVIRSAVATCKFTYTGSPTITNATAKSTTTYYMDRGTVYYNDPTISSFEVQGTNFSDETKLYVNGQIQKNLFLQNTCWNSSTQSEKSDTFYGYNLNCNVFKQEIFVSDKFPQGSSAEVQICSPLASNEVTMKIIRKSVYIEECPHYETYDKDGLKVWDEASINAVQPALIDGRPDDPHRTEMWIYTQKAGATNASILGTWIFNGDGKGTWRWVGPGPYFVSTMKNAKYTFDFTQDYMTSFGLGGSINVAVTLNDGYDWGNATGMLAPQDDIFMDSAPHDVSALNAYLTEAIHKYGEQSDHHSNVLVPPPKPGDPDPECADGIANPDTNGNVDHPIDAQSPGCHTDGDPTNEKTYYPFGNDENALKVASVPRSTADELRPGPSTQDNALNVWEIAAIVALSGAGLYGAWRFAHARKAQA
jgi:cysteine-rich repeat protein